jgi:polyisoprenoid-binding protein YceI
MRISRILVALACGATMAGLAHGAAAADRYMIDKAHTNIAFLIDHLGYSKMLGQFQTFEGEFTFDGSSVSDASVELTIDAASIDTDHEARDNDLRSPSFFNVQEFPEITFVSMSVEPTGEKSAQLTGDLTMLGVTQPLTLDVTLNNVAPSPFNPNAFIAGFSARGTLKRSAFGMKYALPAIGDEVQLIIEVEGIRQ